MSPNPPRYPPGWLIIGTCPKWATLYPNNADASESGEMWWYRAFSKVLIQCAVLCASYWNLRIAGAAWRIYRHRRQGVFSPACTHQMAINPSCICTSTYCIGGRGSRWGGRYILCDFNPHRCMGKPWDGGWRFIEPAFLLLRNSTTFVQYLVLQLHYIHLSKT